MREYKRRTIQEVAACTCDRCKRRLTPDEPGEWQERLSVEHSCGFDSVFGDGNTVSLDLCQHCVREVLGEWLRILPPEKRIERGDIARHPRMKKFAKFGPDFMAEGRGDHEQDKRGPAARRLTALKGIIRKPAKPVSIAGMNSVTGNDVGPPKDARPSSKRKSRKRQGPRK
ncbi:hypothetical protein [Ralstonia pseudosolanacearum]|uniref:hypothetical protein n=1 Tax=Ralstonia pseudosolanacearum TaxID=1310165 RepID=UPI0033988B36